MHELSIALSIIDGALDELRRHEGARADAIHLRLGRLSGVEKDALLFSYDVACRQTALENSRLIIEDVPVSILCPSCRGEQPIAQFPSLTCAHCGAAGQLMHGDELEITSMEIAT
jgi:hydrogenase nickel incorporation protein HypA/HybF